MEQHPVPQNVTTFQFRLIGDMTIKQFGYLAGGAILAYISFKLPLPFFFTYPMAMVFGLGGFGFAFVPIEERPMDIWVLSFIKRIYSPTQYVWQKDVPAPVRPTAPPPIPPATANVATATPVASVSGAQPASRTTSDVLQGMFTPPSRRVPVQGHIMTATQQVSAWDWFMKLFSFTPPAVSHTPAKANIDLTPPPAVAPNGKLQQEALENAKQKEEVLEEKLSTLKKDLEDKSMTEARVLELQKQLTEILVQKEKMQLELEAFRKQTVAPLPPAVTPAPAASSSSSAVAVPQREGPTVKIITPEGAIKAGLPRLTTFPNVVTGIIKDSENNLLPAVLVTVKDKDGMPLRALKTNRLGQFAASTPLANGVYFVEIEDPRARFSFDRVQIALNGSIVPALEIVAKSQKQINRAMLEKELFGKQP